MVLYDNLPPVPENLKLVELGQREFPGWTVGYQGWTGNDFIPAFWLRQGFEGVHVRGRGPDRTVVRSLTSEASLILGRRVGYVKLEGMTFKTGFAAGKQKGIFAGVNAANKPNLVPYTLHLKDCVIEADVTGDPDGHPEWPLFINQGNVVLENVVIKSRISNEHGMYLHGIGPNGFYAVDCEIDGVGAEGFKFTARPMPQYYQDPALLALAKNAASDGYHPPPHETWIVLRRCKVRDWNQPHSWRGGAGLTGQGFGAKVNMLVEDCSFVDFNELKPAIAFDDSGVEHFGDNDIGGGSPANGHVILRRSIFASGPGPAWYNPVLRFGSLLQSTPVQIARSITIEDCGVYGDHMLATIGNISPDLVVVRGCNNENINTRAAALGVDVTKEAMLSMAGFFGPISHGWNAA
jgi:hypothetical protein